MGVELIVGTATLGGVLSTQYNQYKQQQKIEKANEQKAFIDARRQRTENRREVIAAQAKARAEAARRFAAAQARGAGGDSASVGSAGALTATVAGFAGREASIAKEGVQQTILNRKIGGYQGEIFTQQAIGQVAGMVGSIFGGL